MCISIWLISQWTMERVRFLFHGLLCALVNPITVACDVLFHKPLPAISQEGEVFAKGEEGSIGEDQILLNQMTKATHVNSVLGEHQTKQSSQQIVSPFVALGQKKWMKFEDHQRTMKYLCLQVPQDPDGMKQCGWSSVQEEDYSEWRPGNQWTLGYCIELLFCPNGSGPTQISETR